MPAHGSPWLGAMLVVRIRAAGLVSIEHDSDMVGDRDGHRDVGSGMPTTQAGRAGRLERLI